MRPDRFSVSGVNLPYTLNGWLGGRQGWPGISAGGNLLPFLGMTLVFFVVQPVV